MIALPNVHTFVDYLDDIRNGVRNTMYCGKYQTGCCHLNNN